MPAGGLSPRLQKATLERPVIVSRFLGTLGMVQGYPIDSLAYNAGDSIVQRYGSLLQLRSS